MKTHHIVTVKVQWELCEWIYNKCTTKGDSVAEWLACWTQAQYGHGFKSQPRHCRVTVLGKLFLSVHQAAKLVADLLRVAEVTAGLVERNGSLPPGLWLTSPAGWLLRTGMSSGTLSSVVEYGLPLPFLLLSITVKLESCYLVVLHNKR